MVNLLRRATSSSVVDDQAMQTFREQWQIYSKLVDHDYLSHRAAGETLHRELTAAVDRPFQFLDLACGDARHTVAALRGTSVARYHGIDLSAPALAMAQQTVTALPCPAELEQHDFVTAMRERRSADVVWIGLSLHHLHTPDKQAFMHDVRAALGDDGSFMIYEPVNREGESRAEYLDRFERTNHAAWSALTPQEWTVILTHVRTSDFPESASTWEQLGRNAGFTQVRNPFTDPNDLYAVFCFRP